jgi:transposase
MFVTGLDKRDQQDQSHAMNAVTDELLPDDVESLHSVIAHEREAHRVVLKARDVEIEHLREQVRLLTAQRFGRKSEKLATDDDPQVGLFNEAEAEASPEDEAEDANDPTPAAAHARRRGHRAPLPATLPRVDVVHDLAEADKRCPRDGTPLEVMGEMTSEQLDIVPAVIQVLRHRRLKYACPCCRQTVVTAPLAAQPLPKSQASAGLLAHIAVAKYVDALPLYRQVEQFARLGLDASRQTLAHWMVRCGGLAQPLINLLRDRLLESGYLHMDETTVQVLKEPGKTAQSTSYLWVQQSGERERPVVLYDYAPTRSGDGACQDFRVRGSRLSRVGKTLAIGNGELVHGSSPFQH